MALVHGEGQDRWYFSKEELQRTPSVLSGIDSAKELSYRQQSANLIQDMGQRLVVSQLTINTAIVYMHRFYMFHSFSDMNRNDIAPCCLFLSAKLEEQPRKLEHVIKVANICLQKTDNSDQKSEAFQQQSQDLVINESILLQTLGFELTVDHPHTHVVKITQLVRASKDLAQTSYFMATNSLHLTPFCIQHKPSVVACVCIHLACKWSNWEFPRSSDNKDWWEYVDPNVTKETLDTICQEFLTIIENCPSRLKRRINNVTIYKGGHRTKPGEKSSGNSTSTNGDAAKLKGKSPHKEGSSTKREQSSSEISKVDHVITTETPSNPSTERPHDVISSNNNNSTSTVRITENAAVVETPTSTVMLPALQPLTTKYANMPGLSSNSTEHQSKSSNVHQKGPSVNKSKTIPGVKHKHREHDESDSPAKKLKTISSISSHSSQGKHLQRPSSQSKHSFHHTSSKPSSHAMSSLHHKAHLKSGSSGQHHNNFSPKFINKNASHAHHSGSPKLPVRSSSSQGSSAVHHSSSKRQNHPGVPQSSHLHHRSNGNRALMPSSNKHSGSPGLVKKLSEDRHKKPPSTSSRPKQETTGFGTSSGFRSSEMDKGKKYSGEEFFSPPGPQRMPSLPTMPPMNFEKLRSNNAPPLPTADQTNPPPPPLPSNHPPSPPPPP